MSMSPLTVTAPQLRPPHRYIAIEGPICVGKITLVRLLAERWSMRTLFERSQENVFLERFYRDNTRYALPTQEIAAALLGARGHPEQNASAPLITDFLTDKTALFARLTFPDNEFELFREITRRIDTSAPAPNLVVYLQQVPKYCSRAFKSARCRWNCKFPTPTCVPSATPTMTSSITTTLRTLCSR